MEALKLVPYIVLMLTVTGMIIGASAITMGKFRGTTTDTNALYAIDNATDGIITVAEQQSTLAIIGVMVIIISMLAGVFTYFKFFA